MPNSTNRLTVVEHIYHQVAGQNPTNINHGFSRELTESEQVYSRTPPGGIGENWEKLNLGWVENPAMVILVNEATLQETDSVIELTRNGSYDDVCSEGRFLVLPGESFRFTLDNYGEVIFRSRKGKTPYTLYALPK